MNKHIAEQVRCAYGDLNDKKYRDLDWRAAEFVSRDEAISIMKRYVPSYNDFEPDLLLNLPEDCLIRLAREGSVCMYVMTDKKLDQRALLADEMSEGVQCLEENKTARIVRLWWD